MYESIKLITVQESSVTISSLLSWMEKIESFEVIPYPFCAVSTIGHNTNPNKVDKDIDGRSGLHHNRIENMDWGPFKFLGIISSSCIVVDLGEILNIAFSGRILRVGTC